MVEYEPSDDDCADTDQEEEEDEEEEHEEQEEEEQKEEEQSEEEQKEKEREQKEPEEDGVAFVSETKQASDLYPSDHRSHVAPITELKSTESTSLYNPLILM